MKKKNALFSVGPMYAALSRERARSAKRRTQIAWDRMSRDRRRQLAVAAGVSPRVAPIWATLKWRDVPEAWKGALLSNFKNPKGTGMKKKRKKAKRTSKRHNARRRIARRPIARKRRSSRKRNTHRRIRKTTFPIRVTKAQARKVGSWLRKTFNRKIRIK